MLDCSHTFRLWAFLGEPYIGRWVYSLILLFEWSTHFARTKCAQSKSGGNGVHEIPWKFPWKSHEFPSNIPSKILARFPHVFQVKCLDDGTRQMAEDVLLVGSHVASRRAKSHWICSKKRGEWWGVDGGIERVSNGEANPDWGFNGWLLQHPLKP